MFKRGYTINLAPNAINKPAAEEPAATPELPANPERKKKPGKK
jgi:hypothetical protein